MKIASAHPSFTLSPSALITFGAPLLRGAHSPEGSGQHFSQPYAGLDKRSIKSLSEQQIADLRAGRGMSLAVAAELNGYPGPLHVLEHATQLGLTPEQHEQTTALITSMKGETIPLG